MKCLVWSFVLMLGVAGAQSTLEKYNHLGTATWETYQLNGRVKEFKRCIGKSFDCITTRFNEHGVDVDSIKDRKLVSDKDGLVIFETVIFEKDPKSPYKKYQSIEKYQDNHLVEYSYYFDDLPGEKSFYEYNEVGRISKIINYEYVTDDAIELKPNIELYYYQNNKLKYFTREMQEYNDFTTYYYDENQNLYESVSVDDGETTRHQLQLKVDDHGNWIESKDQYGTLTRSFVYY